MEVTETLYVTCRGDWREWLKDHYRSASEIWLVRYLKHTGKPGVCYNDAVEEALCFGWIHSTVKRLDEERCAQRCTPRKARSSYSQMNKERLKRLIERDRVMPDVLDALSEVDLETFEFPGDIVAALQENEQAWANFGKYSKAYQRIRVAYVDVGRGRPGEYEKRLAHLIKRTAQDKQCGNGIEEYY